MSFTSTEFSEATDCVYVECQNCFALTTAPLLVPHFCTRHTLLNTLHLKGLLLFNVLHVYKHRIRMTFYEKPF